MRTGWLLAELRARLFDFAWSVWDRQLASDVRKGRIDRLAEAARQDHGAGRTAPL
jgi:hypothetical protein